jgi:hypothetical protein
LNKFLDVQNNDGRRYVPWLKSYSNLVGQHWQLTKLRKITAEEMNIDKTAVDGG